MTDSDFRGAYPRITRILETVAHGNVNGIRFRHDEQLKDEARKALEILDEWIQPVLPFGNVSDEEITKAEEQLKDRYEHPLIISQEYGTDTDCRRRVNDDPDTFLGMSEDQVRNIAYGAYDEDLDIIMNELQHAVPCRIVVIGYVERWNCIKPVSRTLSDIIDILLLNNGDDMALFVKDGHLRMEVDHHDGTNKYVVYKVRDDAEEFDDNELINESTWHDNDVKLSDKGTRYLESAGADLAAYFGWQDSQKGTAE